jgi:hypothetical protein
MKLHVIMMLLDAIPTPWPVNYTTDKADMTFKTHVTFSSKIISVDGD